MKPADTMRKFKGFPIMEGILRRFSCSRFLNGILNWGVGVVIYNVTWLCYLYLLPPVIVWYPLFRQWGVCICGIWWLWREVKGYPKTRPLDCMTSAWEDNTWTYFTCLITWILRWTWEIQLICFTKTRIYFCSPQETRTIFLFPSWPYRLD